MNNFKLNSAIKVAFIYFLISVLWITLSDYFLLKIINDTEIYRQISTLKGTFFVLGSSLLIYILVSREISKLKSAFHSIENLQQYDV
ncbi:MAG: hypothetical protein KJ847_03390, partial [Firmicutes bacterium]|nr:hypothetical protein [Bacillota bacterium]